MEILSILRQILASPFAILLAIFFFGASIFVHELGHFLAARWRGLKIERFSIGMGPKLFGWRDRTGVEWRISAIPLGGYVLLPQLADMSGIEGNSESDPHALPKLSYTDKMVVAVAGAVFNIIFAFFLASILWMTGRPTAEALTTSTVGVVAEEMRAEDGEILPGPAHLAGLRPGDTIRAVDGKSVHDFNDLRIAVMTGSGQSENGAPSVLLTVERDGASFEAVAAPVRLGREGIRTLGLAPATTLEIGMVFPGSPAETAGLRPGDRVLAANGEPLYSPGRLSEIVLAAPEAPMTLSVLRDGSTQEIVLQAAPAQVTAAGQTQPMIGVRWAQVYVNQQIDPFTQVADIVDLTFTTIGALLNPKTDVGLSAMSGPVGILNVLRVTAQQGFLILLWLVILINVNLAVMNLLPLPILDGGHMAFATWQKLTGHPVPVRVVASLQGAMMFFLLGMILYVSFYDVLRLGDDGRAQIQYERNQEQYIDPVFNPAPPVPADNGS